MMDNMINGFTFQEKLMAKMKNIRIWKWQFLITKKLYGQFLICIYYLCNNFLLFYLKF